MSKTSLVLEGGGMRGAYTAGCLAWMIDQHLEVDYGVGISAGAVNLCAYFLKNKTYLYDIMVKYMSDKHNIGLLPLLHEHRYVGYDYMFDDLLINTVRFHIEPLKQQHTNMEFGIYDLNTCRTDFYGSEWLTDDLRMIKAACTLPIAGRIVDYQGHRFLDGGITIMIPIERALQQGCDRNLVIITKPEGYVRQPAGPLMRLMMRCNYRRYPQMVQHYIHRHESYQAQMNRIEQEVRQGRCLLIRPSQEIPVKRFSGDPENLARLYELGYQDMQNQREAVMNLLRKD